LHLKHPLDLNILAYYITKKGRETRMPAKNNCEFFILCEMVLLFGVIKGIIK